VTHLLLVLDGRKKEELLVAAKVSVEIRIERRRCACLFGGRKKKASFGDCLLDGVESIGY
jgi:hypothetical protein